MENAEAFDFGALESTPALPQELQDILADVQRGYAECALGLAFDGTLPEDSPILSYSWGSGDVSEAVAAALPQINPESRLNMDSECEDFLHFASESLMQALAGGASGAQIGHDFYLTRNGHGAGFWDGGYESPFGAWIRECRESGIQIGEDLAKAVYRMNKALGDHLTQASKSYGEDSLYWDGTSFFRM